MRSSSVLSRSLKLVLAGLFLFVSQACVHAPVRKRPCKGDPEVYRETLIGLSRAYKSLSGTVKVHVETREGKVSFSGDLYARATGELHFDVYGFLHRPRFVLIKKGDTIAWRDFDSGRRYRGPIETCPGFPANFPFSPLFLRDFLRFLFLNFPVPLRIAPSEGGGSSCGFLLTCRWGRFDLEIDPRVDLPRFIAGPKGTPSPFRISFADYAAESSLTIPMSYVIAVRDVKMIFEFKTLKVNPVMDDKIFIPSLP